MTPLRWGLLATAAIGRVVVEATRGSDDTEFVAVAGRDAARAAAFARSAGLSHAFGSEALDTSARRGRPVLLPPGRGPSGD